MAECQERARDMLQPGMENDARKMAKVEDTLLQCISKTVDEHISMLQPMQDRIKSALKDFK
jgi:bacterioferritin (cytochrome b1)